MLFINMKTAILRVEYGIVFGVYMAFCSFIINCKTNCFYNTQYIFDISCCTF